MLIVGGQSMTKSSAAQQCLSFIAEASDQIQEGSLIARYEHLISWFGFETYLMTELPLVPAMGPQDLFIRNNWPKPWWDTYIANRYYLFDPVSIASFKETKPFYWSEALARYGDSPKALEVVEAAANVAGLREGLTFSFSDGFNWKSVVSIGRHDQARIPASDVGLLYLSSIHFGLSLSTFKSNAAAPQLSEREREILLWVACGKTAWEIGQILQIAKTTVDRHMMNIRRSLNAATNAHAVSIAITRGQLRP
jgi:LuxR family transcriptional regulator, quorum-sensing system regulator BjaR1